MAPISLNTQQEPRKSFPPHEDLLLTFQNYAASASTAKALMEHITQNLHEKMTRYNWVGFYLVDPTDSGMLLVGPYVGSFTPNARIPLNTGLCGAAASTGRTVVVHDVSNRLPLSLRLPNGQMRNRNPHLRKKAASRRARRRKLFLRHLHQSRRNLRRKLRRPSRQISSQNLEATKSKNPKVIVERRVSRRARALCRAS